MSNSQNVNVSDKSNDERRAHSDLDLYSRAIDDTSVFPDANLGLGYYTDDEYFQLAEQYKYGMYADAAFAGPLAERAVYEAQHGLARDGWTYRTEDKRYTFEGWRDLDEEKLDENDRRRYIEERGEEIWAELPEAQRQQALLEFAGVTRDWSPPQHEMLKMRHEASRSRDARLLDNLFGRVKKIQGQATERMKEQLQKLKDRGGRF